MNLTEVKMRRKIKFSRSELRIFLLLFLFFIFFSPVKGQDYFNENLLKAFSFRNMGPYRVGAAIADIAVPESPLKAHLYTFYVATWSGGLWKTTNNGTTFEPIFEGHIGDVALAPSNPDIVWLGTGDAFCSVRSHAGDGVYKSTDGGRTWKNMGLHETHHIARIVIHPKNPDIVYVAALGHLYSFNEERGVFKTTDGGQTWQKVLYINDRVGAVDLVINPQNPDILYAATYDKQRLPWVLINGGPESAIYKTTDGGKSWRRLRGGLPEGKIGRIGLDIYLKNPNIVYAVIENANKRPPTAKEAELDLQRGLKPQEREIGGEVYRSEDGGETWIKMNSIEDNVSSKGPFYFSQIRVDPNDDRKIFVTGVCLANSTDGGRTWHDLDWPPRRLFTKMFGDVRTLWIDPQNSDRIIMGSDGGIYISYDGGLTCDHYYNLPVSQIYAVGVDMEEPYNIYCGVQDHEHWKGPSHSADRHGITLLDWVAVGGGDGMYTQVDPANSRWLYTSQQYGGHYRVDQKLGLQTSIMPRRSPDRPPYRFLWTPPIHISPHNNEIIYIGAQVLLRSLDRGENWQEISPDLTTNDQTKMVPRSEGGLPWFAISTLAESPLSPGLIWVGTSDGQVWLTRNCGATWIDLTAKLLAAGGHKGVYISRIFPSHFKDSVAYLTQTGYWQDDFAPLVFKTEDYGATWMPLASNLPSSPINVIFEDRKNPHLLFLGNDEGLYVSINGGQKWFRMPGIPFVPVKDLLIHPRENDLVVATFGRGIYVADISPLQELNEKVLNEEVHLFTPEPRTQRIVRSFGANDYLFGDRHLVTPNEPNGLVIYYYLKNKIEGQINIKITDLFGQELARFIGPNNPGINAIVWDMRRPISGQKGPQLGLRPGNILDQLVEPGEYMVLLEAGGKKLIQKAKITRTIGWQIGPSPQVIR
jgi:photosystem II stability/assembly factor-like uncharacterized protein